MSSSEHYGYGEQPENRSVHELSARSKKRESIFDIIEAAKKNQLDNAGKPNIVNESLSAAIQQGKPKRQLHYNRDTRAIRPSYVGIREHTKIRKQVLQEEGYQVE